MHTHLSSSALMLTSKNSARRHLEPQRWMLQMAIPPIYYEQREAEEDSRWIVSRSFLVQ
jgi:hypothetical protein